MAGKEEKFASPKSSRSDTKFDTTIGFIEDIIMEEEFQELQNNFMDKHYEEFEDTEENKLSYTTIHTNYTELIESYIGGQLMKLLPDFKMEEFQKQLVSRKNELEGEIFEMLVTFTDFLAFKEMMIDYRADKEGRSIDLSSGFMVTPLSGATNGLSSNAFGISGTSSGLEGTPSGLDSNSFGISGTSFGVSGTSCGPPPTTVTLMGDDVMEEGGSTPRLDCGEPVKEAKNGTEAENDVNMESPR